MAYLLQNCSNNLNQYAKRANECGKVYAADMEDLRQRLDELIDIGKQILSKLAELYIFGCGIYTAYRQTWNQFFILLVAEFICFILFFGATAITEGIGRFSEWLAEL